MIFSLSWDGTLLEHTPFFMTVLFFFFLYLCISCCFSILVCEVDKYTEGTAGLSSHEWTDRWWVVPASTTSIMLHAYTNTQASAFIVFPKATLCLSVPQLVKSYLLWPPHAHPKQAQSQGKDIYKALNSILLQSLKAHFLHRHFLTIALCSLSTQSWHSCGCCISYFIWQMNVVCYF